MPRTLGDGKQENCTSYNIPTGKILIFCKLELKRVLWKRLNTESDPKITETSPKWIFWGVSCFFKNYRKSLKFNFQRKFPFFLSVSSIFWSDSSLSGFYIVEGFPNIFNPFPHFLGLFPFFKKSYKFSVCWSVSPFFGIRFFIFWVCFWFSKKKFNSQFVNRIPCFLDPLPHFSVYFRFSEKVVNSQFVDRFPLFFTSFLIFRVSSLISFKFSVSTFFYNIESFLRIKNT